MYGRREKKEKKLKPVHWSFPRHHNQIHAIQGGKGLVVAWKIADDGFSPPEGVARAALMVCVRRYDAPAIFFKIK